MSDEDDRLADEWANAPFVCPGCYAVGEEPCAGYCPDAAIARDRESSESERYDLLDEVDDLLYQPDTEPAPDDGGDDIVQALAVLESALDQSRLDQPGPLPLWLQGTPSSGALLDQIAGLEQALLAAEDHPGARSCVWCREVVLDDFDHDYCAPDMPTEVMSRRQTFQGQVGLTERVAEVVRDEVLCSGCRHWHIVEVTEPLGAAERNLLVSQTFECRCGIAITTTFSWSRRAFVGVRYERKNRVMN